MKSFAFPLPALLCATAVLFTGCTSVAVKKPAGDKAADLDPKFWVGTWICADGGRCISTIKDEARGLLEIRSSDSAGGKEDKIYLEIRELKDRLVATAVPEPGETSAEDAAAFFRIVAAKDYLAVFFPRDKLFMDAVTAGTIAGEVKKAPKEPNTIGWDSTTLKQFGAAEVDRLPL